MDTVGQALAGADALTRVQAIGWLQRELGNAATSRLVGGLASSMAEPRHSQGSSRPVAAVQRDESATGERDKPQPPTGAGTRQLTIPGAKGFGPSAVVLITPAAAVALAAPNPEVHVLVHFHGITGGYGDAGKQRAGWDQIAPQIEGSGRKMIAVLPQAGVRKDKSWGFGRAVASPSDYVTDVMARLKDQEKWAAVPKFSVALSGHSGGGFQAARTLAQGLKPEEVLLFDGINGYLELGSMIDWVTVQLNGALSELKAAAGDAQKEQEALGHVVFFRAYHHGADLDPAKDHVDLKRPFEQNRDAIGDRGYAGRHAILKDAIDQWFKTTGSQLPEQLRGRLEHNFKVVGTAGSEHEPIVGKSGGLEQGLKRTPDERAHTALRRQPTPTGATPVDPVKQQWEDDWTGGAFDGAKAYFNEKSRPAGTPKQRYDILCPMYKSHEGILRPLKYLSDNMGEVKFFQWKTPGHKDLATRVTAAEKDLQDNKHWTEADATFKQRPWALTVRTTSEGTWSNHATGTAIDFDPDTNPRFSNPAERKVITALTGTDIAQANPGAAAGLDSYDASLAASDTFKASYSAAGMRDRIAALQGQATLLTTERDGIQKELDAVPKGKQSSQADHTNATAIKGRLKAKNAELKGASAQASVLQAHLKGYEAVDAGVTAQAAKVNVLKEQIAALNAASGVADKNTLKQIQSSLRTTGKALTAAEKILSNKEKARDDQRLRKFATTGFLDLKKDLVVALTGAGLVWGGDWKGSKDFMHFQTP